MLYSLFTFGCVSEFQNKNFSPTLEVLSQADDWLINEGESIYLELLVWDDQITDGGVMVTWSSDREGLLAEQVPNSDGTLTLVSSRLSAGVHNSVIIATDSSGLSTQQRLEITVNAAPMPPEVQIVPLEPMSGEQLQVQISGGFDPEGSPVNFAIEWVRNGTVVDMDLTDEALIPEGLTQKGDDWSVKVWASDGATLSEMVTDSVRILGSKPQLSDLLIESNNEPLTNSSLLVCSANVDDRDGDAIETSIHWRVQEAGVLSDILHTGENFQLDGDTCSPDAFIVCQVEATDEDGTSSENISVGLTNRQPSVVSHIIEPNSGVRAGDLLVCDAEVLDPDGSPVEKSYRWSRFREGSGTTTVLSLNQTVQLTSDNALRGDIITCEVAGVDPQGLMVDSTVSVEVANTVPEIVDIGVTPVNPTALDAITCTATPFDPDYDAVTLDYAWTVDGVLYPETSSTFTGSTPAGSVVMCTVTPTDDVSVGSSQSTSVTVINSAPIISDVSLSPTEVYTNDVITASVVSTDYDGDSLITIYTWFVNGINVQSGYSATLNGEYRFSKGDEIILETIVSDGFLSSVPVISDILTVLDSPPSIPEVDLGGSYTGTNDDLNCVLSLESIDPDGDPLSYSFSWELNGLPYGGTTETFQYGDDSINYNNTEPQDEWTCMLTVSDGENTLDPIGATTQVTSCAVKSVYNIFDDLLSQQDCWQMGYALTEDSTSLQSFSLTSEDAWNNLAFDDFDFSYYDPSDARINATGWHFFANSWPEDWFGIYDAVLLSTDLNGQDLAFDLGMNCGNPYAHSCRTRTVVLGDNSVQLHPGDNAVYLRWDAPLSGECTIQLDLRGSEEISSSAFPETWPPSETETTVSLMHNHSLVTSTFIESYLYSSQLDSTLTVLGGDIIDIVVTGSQSLAEWTGVGGTVNCSF